MLNLIRRLWREERGATMVEYGLMVALISVVCLAVVAALGDGAFDAFDQSNTQLQTTISPGPVPPTTTSD
jgi:pilus assembly protein Flp/PilA